MRRPTPGLLLPALLISLAGSAHAQAEDGLKLRAGVAQTHDSNLFGRPVGEAERVGTTTLGLSYTKAYSLQRFELSASLVDYSYQTNSYLDFTAHNYSALWRWAVTPRLRGNLSQVRNVTNSTFDDSQNTNQPNQRTNVDTRFDAEYELDGAWRVLAGLTRSSQANAQNLNTGDDYTQNTANVGVRRVFGTGSSVTYLAKTTDGRYTNRALSSTALLDDRFSQTENEVRVQWALSAKTTANLNAAYVSRSHPNFSQRDYSGLNTDVNVNWNISAKTALSASWARTLAGNQTSYASYTQTDRVSFGPSWQISPKTFVGLRYALAHEDYLGAPTALPGASRQDTLRDTTLSLTWQPYRLVSLMASVNKSTRDAEVSNLPALSDQDYSRTQTTLSAQVSF